MEPGPRFRGPRLTKKVKETRATAILRKKKTSVCGSQTGVPPFGVPYETNAFSMILCPSEDFHATQNDQETTGFIRFCERDFALSQNIVFLAVFYSFRTARRHVKKH